MIKMKYFIAPIMMGAMLMNFGGSIVISSATNESFEEQVINPSEFLIVEHEELDEHLDTCLDEDEVEPESKSAEKVEKLKKKTKKKSKKRKKRKKRSRRVYWTEYGKCYHKKLSCIRGHYYYSGSLSTARSWGLRACKKCAR